MKTNVHSILPSTVLHDTSLNTVSL